jgi:hypothetical protein
VPTRRRYQPVASALWRALYMDGSTLAMTLASQSATRLDVLAARAVDLACAGNIRVVSGGALMLMGAPIEIAQDAYRSAVA